MGGAARAYRFTRTGLAIWVAWLRAQNGACTITVDTAGRTVRFIGLYGEDPGTFSGGALSVGPSPVYLTTELDWNPNLGAITGRVCHGNQAGQWSDGVNGAAVTVTGPVTAITTTDPDSNDLFENPPDGAYFVSLAGADPSAVSQSVTVARESA